MDIRNTLYTTSDSHLLLTVSHWDAEEIKQDYVGNQWEIPVLGRSRKPTLYGFESSNISMPILEKVHRIQPVDILDKKAEFVYSNNFLHRYKKKLADGFGRDAFYAFIDVYVAPLIEELESGTSLSKGWRPKDSSAFTCLQSKIYEHTFANQSNSVDVKRYFKDFMKYAQHNELLDAVYSLNMVASRMKDLPSEDILELQKTYAKDMDQ